MAQALVFDNCFKSCSVAIGSGSDVLAEKTVSSEESFKILVNLIKEVSNGKDFSKIILTLGPGSFTGIRIGISLAISIAKVKKIEILGVSCFDAFLNEAILKKYIKISDSFAKNIVVALDSKRAGLCYFKRYSADFLKGVYLKNYVQEQNVENLCEKCENNQKYDEKFSEDAKNAENFSENDLNLVKNIATNSYGILNSSAANTFNILHSVAGCEAKNQKNTTSDQQSVFSAIGKICDVFAMENAIFITNFSNDELNKMTKNVSSAMYLNAQNTEKKTDFAQNFNNEIFYLDAISAANLLKINKIFLRNCITPLYL